MKKYENSASPATGRWPVRIVCGSPMPQLTGMLLPLGDIFCMPNMYKHLSDHYSRPDLRIYTWTLVDRLSYSPYYSITAGDTDFQNEIKMQSIRHVSKRAYGHAFYISDWYQSFRTVDSMLPPLPLATYLVAKIIMSKSKVQRKWKVYMLTICCLLSHVWPTLLALSRGKMQNLLG